jgi:hypothetical protein
VAASAEAAPRRRFLARLPPAVFRRRVRSGTETAGLRAPTRICKTGSSRVLTRQTSRRSDACGPLTHTPPTRDKRSCSPKNSSRSRASPRSPTRTAPYRDVVDNPWPLVVVGRVHLEPLLRGRPGIELRGFIGAAGLAGEFGRASFLVCRARSNLGDSSFTRRRRPVSAASARRVWEPRRRSFATARTVASSGRSDVEGLADAMRWAHSLSPEQLATVSRVSR